METITFTDRFTQLKEKIDQDPKVRTRVAELGKKYEPFICWQNETYVEDRKALYVAFYRYLKVHCWRDLESVMDWVGKINTLHPKQVIKLLNK